MADHNPQNPMTADERTIIVHKLDHEGREIWRYPATILERGPNHVRLEAFFNRDDMHLGYTIFKRGDRFIETFYSDRWYNVFAVYDRDEDGLKGWYCNVCRPAEIDESSVRCEDLALDVWISPDGSALTLDAAEFAVLPLPMADRAHGEAALAALLELAAGNALPR